MDDQGTTGTSGTNETGTNETIGTSGATDTTSTTGREMSSRWCVLCGAEYVAGVLECADCLVPLVDEQPRSPEEVGGEEEAQIAYDLDELVASDRFDLDRRLAEAGIVHGWDAESLIVREADEDRVDPLVDEVADAAGLGDDQSVVGYELSDWTEEKRDELTSTLEAAEIPFEWEDETSEIVVNADDADRVEAIIDRIEYPDQLPVEDRETELEGAAGAGRPPAGGGGAGADDGLAAQEAMSELFVASDRLMHDPEDHEGVLAAVDAARWTEALALPFGFTPAVWNDLVGQARALRRALEGTADDQEIIDRATNLRTLLRQYV